MTILFVLLMGLMFGSFANVCIYRWPRNLSVNYPRRSMCPWCRSSLRCYDNIPVASYLALRGKCRSCGSPISLRYPLVEVGVAVSWTLAYAAIQARWENVSVIFVSLVFLAFFVMLVTTLTDLDWRVIPDEATLTLGAAGLVLAAWNPFLGVGFGERQTQAFIGAAVGGGILWAIGSVGRAILGREAMGGGDIKLLAAFGTVFGWQSALLTLFTASVAGALVALAGMMSGRLRRDQYIPFGPFLNVAAAAVFFYSLAKPAMTEELLPGLIPF